MKNPKKVNRDHTEVKWEKGNEVMISVKKKVIKLQIKEKQNARHKRAQINIVENY